MTPFKIQTHPSAKPLFIGFTLFLAALHTNAQRLENYVSEAQANSPKIEALRKTYGIAKEKTEEVNSFPDTKISGGYFLSDPETRTGAQKAKLSVMQGLPWFGTISARENYQLAEASVAQTKIALAQRKLRLAVSQSYYKLYALKAKQRVTDSIIALLKTYEKLALKAVEVDKASAVDVLQLQVRQNELDEQKAVLQSDFNAEHANFFHLLNRKTQSKKLMLPDSLGVPGALPLDTLRTSAAQRDSSTSISGSTLRQAQRDISTHPELQQYEQMQTAVDKAEQLNQKNAAPNLGVGINYIAVAKRPDMTFTDNGKDIVMPMVSVSIPIFSHKYKSVSRQNALKKDQLKAEKTDKENELLSALAASLEKRKAARIGFHTQQKNLKQTRQAERILMKTYETATLDFDDVLDIEKLRLKIQLKQIEAVKTYYMEQAKIEYLKKPPNPQRGPK